jgi:SHS2 domain-containing protein
MLVNYLALRKGMKDFELIPHTADIKIRAYGATKQELFCNALIGMFQSIHPRIQGCTKRNDRIICPSLPQRQEVEVSSWDEQALLVDFLSHALCLSDIYDEVYLGAQVHELTETHICATLHGVHADGFEVVEIKAVTYHELEIGQRDGIWYADIVFDI